MPKFKSCLGISFEKSFLKTLKEASQRLHPALFLAFSIVSRSSYIIMQFSFSISTFMFRQTDLSNKLKCSITVINAVSRLGSLEAQSRPPQTFKVETFATAINVYKQLTIVTKLSILGVCSSPSYPSGVTVLQIFCL